MYRSGICSYRGESYSLLWTLSNFICLLLILVPAFLGVETSSSITPPTGTVSAPEWSIVYHGSQVESLRKNSCSSTYSSESSAATLTTDCLGGLNSFKNSFFRSHRRRHEYFAARLSDPRRMYFNVTYDVNFDLTWINHKRAIWQQFLLDLQLSQWSFKIEVQDMFTGIPWFSRHIPFQEMAQLLTTVTENGNTKVNSTAHFVMAWDLFLNERVQLVDVHRKPLVAYENISSSEHSLANDRVPFLLSATSTIDCSTCSEEETEQLRVRLLPDQLLDDPIPVTIANVAVQYLSPPTKVVFQHMDHSLWEYVDSFSGQRFHRHPDEVYDIERDVFYDPCTLQRTNSSSLLNHLKISWGRYPGSGNSRDQPNLSPLPRIFCGIYSTQRHHDTKIAAIRSTWSRKCTAFLVFSTVDDPNIPSVYVPHIGDESYDNMWQKSRAIWRYIHRHYLREFDFFLLGGDDMYYIMENLYEYLNSPSILNAPPPTAGLDGLYIGRSMRYEEGNDIDIHQSGGAGYLLDQKALNSLFHPVPLSWVKRQATETTDSPLSNITVPVFEYADVCAPTLRTSAEDAQLGKCLRALGIHAMDTRDENGYDRFHFLYPDLLASFNPEEHRDTWAMRLPLHPVKPGPDCCSSQSISFHYLSAWGQYAIDAFLYKCKNRLDRPI